MQTGLYLAGRDCLKHPILLTGIDYTGECTVSSANSQRQVAHYPTGYKGRGSSFLEGGDLGYGLSNAAGGTLWAAKPGEKFWAMYVIVNFCGNKTEPCEGSEYGLYTVCADCFCEQTGKDTCSRRPNTIPYSFPLPPISIEVVQV